MGQYFLSFYFVAGITLGLEVNWNCKEIILRLPFVSVFYAYEGKGIRFFKD